MDQVMKQTRIQSYLKEYFMENAEMRNKWGYGEYSSYQTVRKLKVFENL